MPIITHKKDPAGIEPSIRYRLPSKVNLLDFLIDEFGDCEKLCSGLACSLYLNGKEIFRSDHNEVDESILDIELGEYDNVVIVNRPAGVLAIASIVIAAVSVAVAVYAYLNVPKLPGQAEGRSESPNNKLNAASNEFRPNQAIPECFGYGVSYPDYIQPSYYYYDNNIKRQVGLFCVSAGTVNIGERRIGDTNIDLIPGSSSQVFLPGQLPPPEFLVTHDFSPNVDGQTLLAPNDPSIRRESIYMAFYRSGGVNYVNLEPSVASDLDINVGGRLYLFATFIGQVEDPENPGEFIDQEVVLINEFASVVSVVYSGVTAVIGFSSSSVMPSDPFSQLKQRVIYRAAPNDNVPDNFVGWFTLAGKDAREIWFHTRYPLGVRSKDGGQITLQVEYQIELLDANENPTGSRWSQIGTITDNTLDAQFVTVRFNPENSPGMPRGQYRARARRITNVIDTTQNASERIETEAFVSVTPYSNPNFGDVTLLLVQRKATLLGSDQAGNKINVDYRRLLPTYNRVTKQYQPNVLAETDSFADAAAYTIIQKAGEKADLEELYGIYDGLTSPRLGSFTFTFDDADVSGGQRIETICNVARVVSFKEGGTWRFNRDELKPISGAMFNRYNVRGNDSVQTWQPQRSDDSDSVRIIYVDPDSNTEAYVERRFNLTNGSIVSGEVGNNVKEIKLAGCRDEFQAINRAELEIRRIAYQRRSVKDVTMRDALSIDLLDRVSWVDINDMDTFDGEIVGFSGDVYDTTERFIPEDGKNYVVFITDIDGYPSNTVTCLPRPDTEFGFIAYGLSGAYVADGADAQLGSRYFIADADDSRASLYTLNRRTPQGGNLVEIELTEYDPRMYEKDGALPPTGSPILPQGLLSQSIEQSATATADLVFLDNGLFTASGQNNFWFSGGEVPGIGAGFEIFVKRVSGATPTGMLDAWIDISGASWNIQAATVDQKVDCLLEVTIRQKDLQDNFVTQQIALQAVNAKPVAMPASLSVEGAISAGNGSASISFNSDGTISTSDSQFASYTTSGDNIGRLYEVRATNVTGAAIANAEQWIQLKAGGAQFRIDSATPALSEFDVEVREIANTANTATIAVSLNIVL